jgi:hypothetical protein
MEILQITSGVIILLTALLQMGMVNSIYPRWFFLSSVEQNSRCMKESFNPQQLKFVLILLLISWIAYLVMLFCVENYVVIVFMFIGFIFLTTVIPFLSRISFIFFGTILLLPWLPWLSSML